MYFLLTFGHVDEAKKHNKRGEKERRKAWKNIKMYQSTFF